MFSCFFQEPGVAYTHCPLEPSLALFSIEKEKSSSDSHHFTPGLVLGTRVSTGSEVNVVPALAELRVQQERDN